MSNQSFLERAFQIADSGLATTATYIRRRLAEEGYSRANISQLGLPSLAKQLLARIKAAGSYQPEKRGPGRKSQGP